MERNLRDMEKNCGETNIPPPVTKLGVIRRFVMSPFTGLFLAVQTREVTVLHSSVDQILLYEGLLQSSKQNINKENKSSIRIDYQNFY